MGPTIVKRASILYIMLGLPPMCAPSALYPLKNMTTHFFLNFFFCILRFDGEITREKGGYNIPTI